MKKSYLILVFLFICSASFAKSRIVYGKVNYATFPVKNIIVKSVKSNAVVQTDSMGVFYIACKKNDHLVIESENFKSVKIRTRNLDSLTIELKLKRELLSNDRATLDKYLGNDNFIVNFRNSENINEDYSIYSNIYQLVKAKLPQVQVVGGISSYRKYFVVRSGVPFLVVNGTIVDDVSYLQPNQ